MKLHLPRRRVWRVAIYLGSFALVLIAADMALVQMRRKIHPGYDTTRIVAPLQPDGSIDYLRAVDVRFGDGVTPENNAAIPLLQALGPQALTPRQPLNGITELLGMPPFPSQGDYFVLYKDYCKQHPELTPLESNDLNHPQPWPIKVDELTARWIKDSTKSLAFATEASKRPRFFIPFYAGYRYETMIEILLPHLSRIKQLGSALNERALIRLSGDDVAGFREDLMTSHRLAHLLAQRPTLIERMVAVAIDRSTCAFTRVGLTSGKLNREQARAMAVELAAIGDLPSFAVAVDQGERVFALDTLQTLAKQGPVRAGQLINAFTDQGISGMPALLRFVPIPYEAAMRRVNHYEDGALAALREPTYSKRLAALKASQEQIQLGHTASLSMWDLTSPKWPEQLFAPALLQVLQKEVSAQMESRLTQIASILAAFKSDHGVYPATLTELSPAYLAVVPIDLFTDKPLIYSRTEKGYLLYSIGPNSEDDQGKKDDLDASYLSAASPTSQPR